MRKRVLLVSRHEDVERLSFDLENLLEIGVVGERNPDSAIANIKRSPRYDLIIASRPFLEEGRKSDIFRFLIRENILSFFAYFGFATSAPSDLVTDWRYQGVVRPNILEIQNAIALTLTTSLILSRPEHGLPDDLRFR